MTTDHDDLALIRRLAPEVLAMLVRRYGHFDACEDAVQEALVAASVQWPAGGRPASPKAWLMTVASRRLIDELRSEESRRRREQTEAAMAGAEAVTVSAADDTLTLLFLCCHPALPAPSQLALTLRAVAGLTTAEIARAFLVPEPTMAQRISRAKQRIIEAGASFRPPPEPEWAGRLRVVLHVLYLLFNEGYTATSGADLVRTDLTSEAIRLTRELLRVVPDDGEVAGLLALMLLTDARRAARTDGDGGIVPLTEQDRTLWDADKIAEGVALVTGALASKPLGPYQVQAAIAASTTRRSASRTPTGTRSSPSTECCTGSLPARWSPSTAPSPWRWSKGRRPVSTHSTPSPPTTESARRIASNRFVPTCSR